MTRRFTYYLVIVGIGAAVAIAWPQLVLALFFFGIAPGAVLYALPTLFLYSLLWWAVRQILFRLAACGGYDLAPRPYRAAAGFVAALIVLIPAVAVPLALNGSLAGERAGLQAGDRAPPGSLALPPVVAVRLPPYYVDRETMCETLCQRLLYNHAVARVIVVEDCPRCDKQRAPAAFSIERGETCPEPALSRREIVWPGDNLAKPVMRPVDRVRARVAAGECLRRAPGRLDEAALVISYGPVKSAPSVYEHQWSLWLDTLSAIRLEAVDAGGATVFRRTEVKAEPLASPLFIEIRAGLLTTVSYAGWGRYGLHHAPLGPNGRDVLPALLGAAARPPDLPTPSPV